MRGDDLITAAGAQPERLLRGFGGGPWSWDHGMSMLIWFVPAERLGRPASPAAVSEDESATSTAATLESLPSCWRVRVEWRQSGPSAAAIRGRSRSTNRQGRRSTGDGARAADAHTMLPRAEWTCTGALDSGWMRDDEKERDGVRVG